MTAGRLFSKIMIEGEDAIDLGAREVERGGDHRNCRLRHIAERFLERVQDHQRRSVEAGVLGDDFRAACLIPGFVRRSHWRTRSESFCSLDSVLEWAKTSIKLSHAAIGKGDQ